MERLTVGRISKPQGVGGEVKIAPLTDDVKRFGALKRVFIRGEEFAVVKTRISPNGVFVKLQGIDSRDQAEALRDEEIQIDRTDAVKLPKDRYFIVDIIGCDVYAGDKAVGRLVDVLQHGAADVYVVNTARGSAMFPAINRILLDVDVENKKIILDAQAFDDLAIYSE